MPTGPAPMMTMSFAEATSLRLFARSSIASFLERVCSAMGSFQSLPVAMTYRQSIQQINKPNNQSQFPYRINYEVWTT
jgi:hypothetical protein